MEHFADRLMEAIRRKGAPICAGLDPVWERLPQDLREAFGEEPGEAAAEKAGALVTFCDEVLELVAPLVPAVKVNIAFFERHHPMHAFGYFEIVKAAQERGLIVIGDVKRADIGHTSSMYAAGHLSDKENENDSDLGCARPDAVTINPYFGTDGVAPFIEVAKAEGKGVFVLAQTSNASAGEVQGLALADGRTVREAVAQLIDRWGRESGAIGSCGYSCVGAVVSPTDVEQTRRLRQLMPQSLFLVPGFGAQGRTAQEVAACFNADGRGAIVASSRGVIFAYEDPVYRARHGDDWRACIADACRQFREDVAAHLPR